MMWSSLRQHWLGSKGPHGESHTLRSLSVSWEAVFVALEPISFACHPGFLFLVQPYARNLPVPKLAQCHHHTPLWGAGLLVQAAFLMMKKNIALYLAMLSEDCSDNTSSNHMVWNESKMMLVKWTALNDRENEQMHLVWTSLHSCCWMTIFIFC